MAVIEHLLQPLGSNWDWQLSAACRGMDSAAFFPVSGDGVSRHTRIKAAKAVCKDCPVAQQCLEYALQAREPYGIWGGRSEDERAKMLGLRSLQHPAPREKRADRVLSAVGSAGT